MGPAVMTWRAKRLKLQSQDDRRVTQLMLTRVTPVFNMSNAISALTNASLDSSSWFDNNSLDSSGQFDSAAGPKDLCLDHGCNDRKNSVCWASIIWPKNEAYEASTTVNV